MRDIIIFEDGDRIRKKLRCIEKIEDNSVFFTETHSDEYMMIPVSRIIRIVRDKGVN